MCKLSEIKLTPLVLPYPACSSSNKLPVICVCRGFPMLKYVVIAVFSICALPCFATAQDCGCGGSTVMAAPMMGAPMDMGAPMMDMGAPMDMGVSSDCGCGEPVADCGCAPEPSCAPRTRKKLTLTKVSKEVCRLKRVCTTDCCGCPKSKLVRVKKTVCRTKLTCVDVPRKERSCCLGSRLKGLFSGGCGCRAQADPCGCDAPVADCGCGQAAPVADCGCGS